MRHCIFICVIYINSLFVTPKYLSKSPCFFKPRLYETQVQHDDDFQVRCPIRQLGVVRTWDVHGWSWIHQVKMAVVKIQMSLHDSEEFMNWWFYWCLLQKRHIKIPGFQEPQVVFGAVSTRPRSSDQVLWLQLRNGGDFGATKMLIWSFRLRIQFQKNGIPPKKRTLTHTLPFLLERYLSHP